MDYCCMSQEPQKHAQWKPDPKDVMLYDSIYVKHPEKVNL